LSGFLTPRSTASMAVPYRKPSEENTGFTVFLCSGQGDKLSEI
jgi:hypothetical protein